MDIEKKRAQDRERAARYHREGRRAEYEEWRRLTRKFYRLLRYLDDPTLPSLRGLAQKAGIE